MGLQKTLKETKPWVWKIIGAFASMAAFAVSMTQLSEYYWDKVDNLVKGSVTQSAVLITTELKKTERAISSFLIDDIQFRIIGVQDEIAVFTRARKHVPIYLNRQLELLKDQLEEAKEKWEK